MFLYNAEYKISTILHSVPYKIVIFARYLLILINYDEKT